MAFTYDPKKTNAVVDGHYVTGYMDGTFITIEKNEDNVVPHVGAQGDVTYSESADETATITFTLKQNSPSLLYLQNLSKRKKEFSTQVIDSNTNGSNSGGNQCRIIRTPGREYGAEVSGVEVSIHVADFSIN
jgi:hypothetical protein